MLEHGAWADASGWSSVISRLQRRGFTVYAPPNPLLNGMEPANRVIASAMREREGRGQSAAFAHRAKVPQKVTADS